MKASGVSAGEAKGELPSAGNAAGVANMAGNLENVRSVPKSMAMTLRMLATIAIARRLEQEQIMAIVVVGDKNSYQLKVKEGIRVKYVEDIQKAEKLRDENQNKYIVIIINNNTLQILGMSAVKMTVDIHQVVDDFLCDV